MKKSSILVVEDETIVAMDIEERLTRMGYVVTGLSSSGKEAIMLAEARRPDIVLMDIHLKGSMDGICAADEIRRQFRLPVIFLTAYSEEKTLERAKQVEPFGYILKPFKETDLKSTIEIALYKHRSETRLYRMNRLLDTMTLIGQSIIRSSSREELFPAVCRVLVEHGGIDLAWIGWFNIDRSRLEPLASCGKYSESVQPLELDADNRPGGPNELGQAFHEGKPYIDNHFHQNLCACFLRNPIFNQRFQTAAIFPIQLENRVVGALNLCVDEPDFWGQQEIDAFIKTTSDISFALQKIEGDRHRRILMEQSRDGIVTLDQDGKVVEANRSFADMLGYPVAEVARLNVWDWDALMTRQELAEAIRLVDAAGDHFTTRHRRKDGTIIDVEITSTAAEWEGQKRILCTCRDISDRIKTEAALRESERRYRMVADYTHDWEYWIRPDGTFVYVSPSCERITGYSADKFIRDPALMKSIVHPDDRDWFDTHLHECLQAYHDVCQRDFRIITRRGEVRWMNHNCQSIRDENGVDLGTRASNRDISDRVKVMEEKEKMEERLRNTQKMEAIGTLAGGIAHDFNNILSPIIGYTEMSLDEVPQTSPIRKNLEQILEAADRAKDLVRQILSFSRRGEDQSMLSIDVSQIVQEVLGLLRASLPSSIEIRQHLEKVQILANVTQMHQVIVNLCTNAAHAMEDKGTLGISISSEILNDKDIETLSLLALKPGKYLRLSVSDTGQGMTAETMSRIFEPYYTTKELGKGTGLGLAVVHGIVQRHNGEIRIQSEPGKGSIFDVYIPAAGMAPTPENKTVRVPPPEGSERILFIDDEPKITVISARMLKQLGYHVTAFTHPREALESFQAAPSDFDLIITDNTMPYMTGMDLIGEIKRIRQDIPAILCTGYSNNITEEHLRQKGIRKLAMKPLDRRQLAELVRMVLDEPSG